MHSYFIKSLTVFDAMAKYSLVSPRGSTMLCSPPSQVAGIVYDDIAGADRFRSFG